MEFIRLERAPFWGALLLLLGALLVEIFGVDNLSEFFLRNPTVPIIAVTALVAFKGLQTQRHLARIKNAIDFQNNYLSSEASKADITAVAQMCLNKTSEEFQPENLSEDEKKRIRAVLNSFERMAIGIELNAYDPNVLFRSYASTVITMWGNLRPFIADRQKSNLHTYCNVDKLAIDWMSKRAQLTTREDTLKMQRAQRVISSVMDKQNKKMP